MQDAALIGSNKIKQTAETIVQFENGAFSTVGAIGKYALIISSYRVYLLHAAR